MIFSLPFSPFRLFRLFPFLLTMPAQPPANLSRNLKFLVVFVLYFAEGVPFGFVYTTLSYYLRSRGVPLEQIGILSLLGLAWSLKVLWSPLADRFGTRAAWLVPAQVLVILSMLGLAYVANAPVTLAFWVLVGVLCLASATQDLAVDAYTIDLLETDELGMANGIRIGAYRVGLIAAGGGVLIASDLVGWSPTFVGVAVIMAALALTVVAFSPFHQARPEVARAQTGKGLGQIKESVQVLMRHPHMGAIIVFILAYKAGDAFLGAMVSPFWRDMGFSGTQFGVASITVGKIPAIVGRVSGRHHHRPLGHQPGPVAPGHPPGLLHPGVLGRGPAGQLALHDLPGHPDRKPGRPDGLRGVHGLPHVPVRQTLQRLPLRLPVHALRPQRPPLRLPGRLGRGLFRLRHLLLPGLSGGLARLRPAPLGPAHGAKIEGREKVDSGMYAVVSGQ